MAFEVGSLVEARGREWVVLPESREDLLLLRPLGGTDEEVAGIYLPLETVRPATFDLPGPDDIGDFLSCRLLRDALRLGFRSSAGPFRCFGKLAFEPRPYQIVPLLMGLKLDPVRLLIADDVGVGKTIEASLIVKELLERGLAYRLAVLCSPQLAEQWYQELKDKFGIEAQLVLASTAARLERECGARNETIFDIFPHVVVSTDYIKSDRRRDDFLRTCPELVIVDEAHTCAYGYEKHRGRHQRYQLVKGLSENRERHLILVTATPHSGKEATFRSLLSFLDPVFADLPDELGGTENESHRRRLARHFVMRRRKDILEDYPDMETPFPEREEAEETYELSPEYQSLFNRVMQYAWETVQESEGKKEHHRRVRWWSVLALLRSLASSPAAAAATLRTRAATLDTESAAEADEIGRRTVLDQDADDFTEGADVCPGSNFEEITENADRHHQQLLRMAREAEKLRGAKDAKLLKIAAIVKRFVTEGYNPIIFCRFIPTAEYVAGHLRKTLPGTVEVAAVTGTLPPAEREERVGELGKAGKRVLVCTDCLSEGINLQEHFDAVIHYDLSWNPTRHEQRQGRVDRFGQKKPTVRTLLYYSKDTWIDGAVLKIIYEKYRTIKSSLGISVPVPANTSQVMEAIMEGVFHLRKKGPEVQLAFNEFEEYVKPQASEFELDWDNVSARQKRSQTMFAQRRLKPKEVYRELQDVRSAIGSHVDVAGFTRSALAACRAMVSGDDPISADLSEVPPDLRDLLGVEKKLKATFNLPVRGDETYLTRTHPLVENLAAYVLDTALDPLMDGKARRCGVVRTGLVKRQTVLLLLRLRYQIVAVRDDMEFPQMAEECRLAAFEGFPDTPDWLSGEEAENLLDASPEGNVYPDLARSCLEPIFDDFSHLWDHLDEFARKCGDDLLESHRRVLSASRTKNVQYRIEPKLHPDVLGLYVYFPKPVVT